MTRGRALDVGAGFGGLPHDRGSRCGGSSTEAPRRSSSDCPRWAAAISAQSRYIEDRRSGRSQQGPMVFAKIETPTPTRTAQERLARVVNTVIMRYSSSRKCARRLQPLDVVRGPLSSTYIMRCSRSRTAPHPLRPAFATGHDGLPGRERLLQTAPPREPFMATSRRRRPSARSQMSFRGVDLVGDTLTSSKCPRENSSRTPGLVVCEIGIPQPARGGNSRERDRRAKATRTCGPRSLRDYKTESRVRPARSRRRGARDRTRHRRSVRVSRLAISLRIKLNFLGGDLQRARPVRRRRRGAHEAPIELLNWNKRSVVLDLHEEAGASARDSRARGGHRGSFTGTASTGSNSRRRLMPVAYAERLVVTSVSNSARAGPARLARLRSGVPGDGRRGPDQRLRS